MYFYFLSFAVAYDPKTSIRLSWLYVGTDTDKFFSHTFCDFWIFWSVSV